MPDEKDAARAGVGSEEIALCLSGGGYRAAAFHLGALDVFERLGLLGKVRVLATISGGTLLGVLWTLARARGRDFGDFFRGIYRRLLEVNVVREAFARLDATGDAERPPSLARAAAEIYGGPEFAGTARLGELMDSEAVPDDVLFCSTEMRTGLAFRFQTSRRSQIVVGSRDVLRIPPELARELRLADVMAASACFPGAFEPLLFPQDFDLGTPPPPSLASLPAEKLPLPIVDGGVFDNHGIDAARRVYDRRGASPGLIFVSDSSPRETSIYGERPPRPGAGWSLGFLLSLGRFLSWLAALLAVLIVASASWSGWRLTDGIALLALVAMAGGLWLAHRRLGDELAKVKEMTGVAVWDGLEKVSLGELLELIDRRARTLIAITSTIFLKRIRGLQQEICFVDGKLRDRVVFSLIYTLLEPSKALEKKFAWLLPGRQLAAYAEAAEKVGTKLWFDHENELRAALVAGQATTLHKLLELHCSGRLPAVQAILGPDFESRARALWEKLQENPEALLDRAG